MRKQMGFTLVELVVVVMILGILAAVAAPKLLGTSARATDNGVKQTLAVVRDAIERFAAENGGELPGSTDDSEADFKADLVKYLRGPFPKCPVGIGDATVDVIALGEPAVDDLTSWMYSSDTGTFIVNCSEATATDDDGATTYNQL
jgi:prepilin-type N-terminal cleavage/methylation domain-containing protein